MDLRAGTLISAVGQSSSCPDLCPTRTLLGEVTPPSLFETSLLEVLQNIPKAVGVLLQSPGSLIPLPPLSLPSCDSLGKGNVAASGDRLWHAVGANDN